MSNFDQLIDHIYANHSVLLIGEDHYDPAGKALLANSLETLSRHDVLQVREIAIWLNPILDAHREKLKRPDGSLFVDDDRLLSILTTYYEGEETGLYIYNSIIPFHKASPPQTVMGIDPRFDEKYIKNHDDTYASLLGYKKADRYAPLLALSKQIGEYFPEHNAIEEQAQEMIAAGITVDSAAAWIALQYAQKEDGTYQNIAGVYGVGHIIGRQALDNEMDGVLDETLSLAGFDVFTLLTSRSSNPLEAFEEGISIPDGSPSKLCTTSGSFDAIYVQNLDLAFNSSGELLFNSTDNKPLRLDFSVSTHLHKYCPENLPSADEKYGSSIAIPIKPSK